MKNHKCAQEDIDVGNWISRSVATCFVSVFKLADGIHILAAKRGPEVEHSGKWSMLGGFVDYDETLKQACCREFHEESGGMLRLNPKEIRLWKVDDIPEPGRKQTITHYFCLDNKCDYRKIQIANDTLRNPVFRYKGSSTFRDKNMLDLTSQEVEEIRLINIKDLDKYDWGLGHFQIIMEFIQSGLMI